MTLIRLTASNPSCGICGKRPARRVRRGRETFYACETCLEILDRPDAENGSKVSEKVSEI